MITTKIGVEPYVAEYIRGKYYDETVGAVRFPRITDVYVLVYDLLQRRPDGVVDCGNLEFALPDRREGSVAGGKSPEVYNYLSATAAAVIARKLAVMMWAELHEIMDENKHLRGIRYKESVLMFLERYKIESITEDALLKNYQRWRDRMRRSIKRDKKPRQKKQ